MTSQPEMRERLLREAFDGDEGKLSLALNGTDLLVLEHFALVGLLSDDQGVETLRRLPFVEFTYEPPTDIGLGYANIVSALHSSLMESKRMRRPTCLNLSLGPGRPYPFDPTSL